MSRTLSLFLLLVLTSLPAMGQTLGLGLDPFPKALAGTSAQARPSTLKPSSEAPLPRKVDLGELVPPVKSQGQIGSCAAWSTVYYGRTMLEQKERGWGTGQESHQFAPLYSYNQITQGKNEGTAITAHMQILKDQGIVSLSDFPWVDKLDAQPGDDLKARAADLKIEDYKSLPRKEDSVDLDAVKSFLAQGIPVIGGFDLFDDFYGYRGGLYQTTKGTPIGGHAMAVVGYDDDQQALHIVNSWGPDWGERGYLWLSYESVRAMTKTNYGFAVMFDQSRPQDLTPPHDLTATKGAAEDGIALTWSPQEGADRYTVLRADNDTKEWKTLATVAQPGFTDSPLPAGVTYVYAIQSQQGEGKAARKSAVGPVAEGWTQKKAAVPGIVQGLDSLVYKDGVVLVWPKLAATDEYQVFRFDEASEDYLMLGTSQDTAFRDEAPFTRQDVAFYTVVAVNAQGAGLPGPCLIVIRPGATDKVPPKPTPEVQRKLADDRPLPPAQQKAYRGTFAEGNWFDPKYVDKEFQSFAAQEKAAFEAWKRADQADFEEFLKNDH